MFFQGDEKVEKKKLMLVVCALAIGLTAGLASADIETGLVGYWLFEEGDGDTTFDASDSGHLGTLINTPSWVSGPDGSGGALSFNIADESHVECTNFNPASAEGHLSIALWVYQDATAMSTESSAATLVAKRGDDGQHMFHMMIFDENQR